MKLIKGQGAEYSLDISSGFIKGKINLWAEPGGQQVPPSHGAFQSLTLSYGGVGYEY